MRGVRSWSTRAQREVAKGPPEAPAKHRSKKDTKRWCRGVEGREHKWEFGESKSSRDWNGRGWRGGAPETALICAGCKRERSVARGCILAGGKLGPGF